MHAAGSLVYGEKLDADVIAADVCDVYSLSVDDFRELVNDFPEFQRTVQTAARKESRQSDPIDRV